MDMSRCLSTGRRPAPLPRRTHVRALREGHTLVALSLKYRSYTVQFYLPFSECGTVSVWVDGQRQPFLTMNASVMRTLREALAHP